MYRNLTSKLKVNPRGYNKFILAILNDPIVIDFGDHSLNYALSTFEKIKIPVFRNLIGREKCLFAMLIFILFPSENQSIEELHRQQHSLSLCSLTLFLTVSSINPHSPPIFLPPHNHLTRNSL